MFPHCCCPSYRGHHRLLLAADINFTWDQEWEPLQSLLLPAIRLGKNGCMFVALEGVATEKKGAQTTAPPLAQKPKTLMMYVECTPSV